MFTKSIVPNHHMLSFKDFDAWLEGSRGRTLKHSIPIVNGSTVSAVVDFKPKSVCLLMKHFMPRSIPNLP